MKTKLVRLQLCLLAALALGSLANAGDMQAPLQAKEIKWGPAPPVFAPGLKMAVLAGDPGASGFVSVRLKMPAGYKIAPHWHPTDEHVTVISGTLAIGMGDKLDKTKSKSLTAGGYAIAPAKMHHFAWTRTGAVVEVNMIGPFALTYVDPMDDPSKAK